MSGLQEGLSFANQVSPFETWELLEKLDNEITLRWVVPEKSYVLQRCPVQSWLGDADVTHRLSTKEMTYERVWRRPGNSTNVVFHFAGHLVRTLALAVSLADIFGV